MTIQNKFPTKAYKHPAKMELERTRPIINPRNKIYTALLPDYNDHIADRMADAQIASIALEAY